MTPASIITFDGETKPIKEWALDYGITPEIIIGRLERGEPADLAITSPMRIGTKQQRLPIYHSYQRSTKARAKISASGHQSRPGRKPKRLTHNGESLTLDEWASRLGVTRSAIRQRIKSGWPLEKVLAMNVHGGRHSRTIVCNGEARSIRDWSTVSGISLKLINRRLNDGWSTEDAIFQPAAARKPGVAQNLSASEGTGAGSTAQEIAEITFSKKAQSE